MKVNKISVTVALFSSGLIFGCSYNKDMLPQQTDCIAINARFSADIQPVIQSSCAANPACHGSGSVNGPGALLTYNQVQAAASMIKVAVETRRMPLGSSLNQAEINKISCWVNSGAPNN
ncbi:MAG TPA: hypothetical protein VJ765_00010 [Chitinophagaceae bacterium]|nr:hypothetical protein [Chitinophagaceae bacterium]